MASPNNPSQDTHAVPVKERDEPLDLQAFLDEIQSDAVMHSQGLDAREAASAVMCTLARRLSEGEDVKLFRALSGGIGEEILGACTVHLGPSRARRIGRDEFMTDVADHLKIKVDQAARVVAAVFTAVRDRIPEEEVAAVASQLPADLGDYFRRPV
ncbi:DUF2267 domain-containing protein [Corallococcus praedator]|uniref:DUF2267 domain-containing protein n=1 Tax=Corallococcus praedator TaxID=2316724 RepID=A0ABX9QDL9_9BACT|nr:MULTISPECIES: DUF2267 domain-containing protein [Corallococcus]RKH25723.1 DUF2267 domain-containing protein [Corallococcus sp. CA031C]RKI03007.1 DUF2267 domain-containing protein [Corallococcus praedator]